MTSKLLWSPKKLNGQIEKFKSTLPKKFSNKKYSDLHKWSIKNINNFWSNVWDFTNIIGEKKGRIYIKSNNFINSKFFTNSKLNFTENCLIKNNNSDAIIYYSEQKEKRKYTWKELNEKTFQLSAYLIKKKIKSHDRIAAVLPNFPETIIAFLATAQIGAIWSSCSADFGSKAIIERFKQIKPKILFVTNCYFYNNKKIKTTKIIPEIISKIPSIQEVILIPYLYKNQNFNFKYTLWDKIFKDRKYYREFKKFNFNHPLYILYSSGTTGLPKCIVHGAGGSLIQHKKEHQLHANIIENDRVFYFTTCGWMMWNWLVSSLSSGATIILYEGSPFFPKIDYLFEIAKKEKISFFGTGAKYLDYLKQNKINIKKKYKLNHLKTIASTGSPLMNETFEYVYSSIKKNVHLTSISGGTDIVSCFVLGNPTMPVFSGEIQCAGLGMDVDVFDENGKSLKNKKGELVCKTPFPSKPLYLWNDKKNQKYFQTYFNKYKNVWHHGDYCKKTLKKGYIIYGRSDATLNSGGVRIGTGELYRVVENINEIAESLAVERKLKNDTEVVLFVKMNMNHHLNNKIIKKIKNNIKLSLSPKHIPSKIFSINDIPKTKSGKIVELSVKKIINGEKINNLESISNSDCLKEYENIYKIIN